MRRVEILMAGIALASASVAAAAPKSSGPALLARALEGRVAGKPVECVTLRRVKASRIIHRTAVIFEVGSTLYVNVPVSGGELLSDLNALIMRNPFSQLCRGQAIELIDSNSGIQAGPVFLGQFVPYKKPPMDFQLPQSGGTASYK